jgi:Tol biopolymer transport system component
MSDTETMTTYSWDGTKIAFESNRSLDGSDTISPNNTLNIWVMNADGSSPTAVTKLTANRANSFGTVIWSANRTQIVFDSSRALDGTDAANSKGTVNIWIINADGTSAMPLTNLTAAGAAASCV